METSLDSWFPSALCKWQDSVAVDCILLVYLGQHGVLQLGKCGPLNCTVPTVVHVSLVKGFLSIGRHSVYLEPRTELHLVAGDFLRVVNVFTVYKRALQPSALFVRLFLYRPSLPAHLQPLLLLAQTSSSFMADIEKVEPPQPTPQRQCQVANPVPLYVAVVLTLP